MQFVCFSMSYAFVVSSAIISSRQMAGFGAQDTKVEF